MKLINKSALVAEIERFIFVCDNVLLDKDSLDSAKATYKARKIAYLNILSIINTLETKECEAKSGIVQKDLQIVLDDGMYIDLDPSMQLKPSFSVKEGEKVKIVISKED